MLTEPERNQLENAVESLLINLNPSIPARTERMSGRLGLVVRGCHYRPKQLQGLMTDIGRFIAALDCNHAEICITLTWEAPAHQWIATVEFK